MDRIAEPLRTNLRELAKAYARLDRLEALLVRIVAPLAVEA